MSFIKDLLLPPVSLYLALIVGSALELGQFGWFAGAAGLVGLILLGLSTPIVARTLMIRVAGVSVDGPPSFEGAGAILLFAGGASYPIGHPDRNEPDQESWERLRGAVHVYRATGLPMIVSGWSGRASKDAPSTAELIVSVLHDEFGIASSAMTVEPRARNTAENGRFTAAILRDRSIRKAILVTHFFHMRRARDALEREGIEVIPAPVGTFIGRRRLLQPNMGSLWTSHLAIREGLAILLRRLAGER